MLRIFNDLKPFFKDNYRRINVREFSRIAGISPPSASKLLERYRKEGLLVKETERNYIYYFANKDEALFIELSRAYWLLQLRKTGLIEYLKSEYASPIIILFGSFSKAEINENSDIDIAIFGVSNKAVDVSKFEKKLGKKIQLFQFKAQEAVENKNLLKNILNGFILYGGW